MTEELSIQANPLPESPEIFYTYLAGSINATTVTQFAAFLEELKGQGVCKFILDMINVQYVNSTGLGMLVNLADGFEKAGGGLVLARIHPKVKVVFDMLGLDEFFKILKTKEAAIEYLSRSSEERQKERESVERPKRDVAGKVVRTSGEYPLSTACANCRVMLRIPIAGYYICPRCSTLLEAEGAQVTFVNRRKNLPLQFTLSSDDTSARGLIYFVSLYAKEAGFEMRLVNRLQTALKEVLDTIIDNAYRGNRYSTFNVIVTAEPDRLVIRTGDAGRTQDAASPDFLPRARNLLSRVEHRPHPRGGNLLKLTLMKQK